MPTPLSPSSSQEIIPISPPRHLKRKIVKSESTSIPKPQVVKFSRELEERVHKRVKEQEKKIEIQNGARERDGGSKKMKEKERGAVDGLSRSEIISRMLKTLGKDVNPITNSDLYSRTDHFISAATGHQQSNRGGGSAGAATYWEVRNAKMAEQAREKRTEILGGCVFYINGSTGPKVSNLMLQQMITSNGGRFTATQSSSCTHIIANGGLSGSKTQKWINGQGGRGGLKRLKIVNVDWVLDSVEKGIRLSEVGYGVIENPSQRSLLDVFAIRPTKEGTS